MKKQMNLPYMEINHLCRNVKILHQKELASLFQVQEKLKERRRSKLNFSSSCFIANNSHVKIV